MTTSTLDIQRSGPVARVFLNRPEVIEPTSSDGWTLEGLRTFGEENLSGAFSGKWARYAIITEEGRLLGSVGLFNVDSRHNRVEIGYDLSPEAWGHGWMTRAGSGWWRSAA